MSEIPTVSVSELVSAFREVVESALPRVCVQAEISNCRRSGAGHYYLTLKDERSEIGAVIWRGTAARMQLQPQDGMKVLATGSLEVYVARGTCQFIVERMQAQGMGDLEMAFRRLKEKLQKEGLFDRARKRPLPRIPRRVALVTSPSSAAVRDMIQVMTRRWPGVQLIIVGVPVQGDHAAPAIARGLRMAARIPGVDVIVTGRGGGSLEDLWAFNEEVVARAIADSFVPVVSAVGHETDVSIADLVADRRALTPSEAGELVVPSAQDLKRAIAHLSSRASRALRQRLAGLKQRLAGLEERSVFLRPQALINFRRQTCDELGTRLERAIDIQLERRRAELTAISAALDALSPLKVLSRGYSLTTRDGELLTDAEQVAEGDLLETRLADGSVLSRVVTDCDSPGE